MGSVKKAIKIYARLKPADSSSACKYEIDKHINDDGSTDDILILNSGQADDYATQSMHKPDAYKFRYSKVFDGGSNSNQEEIFDEICQPVLISALEGYNGTIFAYGQTGSGKTYTMTGSRQQWRNRGIIPRSLSFIFEKFNQLTESGFIASAFLSYLEIYNENGYDLLHSGFSSGRIEDLKKVQLLEDSQQQIHMRNLTVHPIKSEDEAMQLLYLGDHNRIIAETPMNEASTRSHCIFTIHLNIREGDSSTVRRSKVHLVDLAGSERLANSNSTGQLFHEARHINLALHYLEQVIVALGEAHRSHIPYRNSMMTSILRDSLGGNCMTSMIATLSLEHRNIMETLSTCRFSQRVALVTNAAILNEETDPMLLIAQLKSENKRLKEIIAGSSIRSLESNPNPLSQEEVSDCWKLVEKFLSDGDDEALLPVPPDMRMVHTCFRCLKMATQTNKDNPSVSPLDPGIIMNRSDSKYSGEMSKEQLLEALRIRDAEIDVLTKMLRPQKKNSSKFCNSNGPKSNFSSKSSHYEHGDGPGGGFPGKEFPQEPYNRILECDEDTYDYDQTSFQKMTINHQHPEEIPGKAPADFDAENWLGEGLSETKKHALDSFMRSYKGRERLESVRDNLLTKRSEVESVESLLKRNHANLQNLKVVMLSSDGGEEDSFIREAVDSQTQSIQKQEIQLHKSKEEMRHIEDSLKSLFAQLMSDFEKHWLSIKELRGRNDFEDPDPDSKPYSDVTKGLVKSVGGRSTPRSRLHMSSDVTTSVRNPNDQFYISAPAHLSKSCYSPSSRRSHSSARKYLGTSNVSSGNSGGKRSPKNPQNSPRDDPSSVHSYPASYSTSHPLPVPRSHPQPIQSRVLKVPPATPDPPTKLELLHRNNHEFASQSTVNFNEGDMKEDEDKEDEELMKDLPMTGDVTIDQEILAFFRTRQAVFKRINSDKDKTKARPQTQFVQVPHQQQLISNRHHSHQYHHPDQLSQY